MTFLEVRGLRSGYHGSTVVFGADLELEAGGALALLGRNGVGKSTLVHTICGLVPASSGSVCLDGTELTGHAPDVAARAGIGLVPQGRRVFGDVTVAEHLDIAEWVGRDGPWTRDRVIDLLPRLGERRDLRAENLSGGEQQMLAIARALLTNPTLLLLDEPSEGLAPAVVGHVRAAITDIVASGTAVLLVEQDLHLAFAIGEEVAVMDKGRIVLREPTDRFRRDAPRARRLLGVG